MKSTLLKSQRELAAIPGLSTHTVSAMELQGCPFPAGKCTVQWALEWLKANPNFRPAPRVRKPKTKLHARLQHN
jgi:hypothetical protein